jgi:hypothetical protein
LITTLKKKKTLFKVRFGNSVISYNTNMTRGNKEAFTKSTNDKLVCSGTNATLLTDKRLTRKAIRTK